MTNAGNRIEPLARLVGSMPGRDHAVELQELCFQGSQLGAESQQTGACNLGQSFVTYIGDDTEEVFNTSTSNRCDDAKLGKMGTDRVDNLGLLANKQMPRAMEHQAALLFRRVLVATNRMLALLTASQIASASVASFFCRLT